MVKKEMSAEEMEDFIRDQKELERQYQERIQASIGILISTFDNKDDKAIEYLNTNSSVVQRAQLADGTMTYDDAEKLAKFMYDGSDEVIIKSDRLKNLFGIFSEAEIQAGIIKTVMFDFDPEIEDRLSVPQLDKYDYFLLELRPNEYCIHCVPKDSDMSGFYIKDEENSEKFDFPTYKVKTYFGISF